MGLPRVGESRCPRMSCNVVRNAIYKTVKIGPLTDRDDITAYSHLTNSSRGTRVGGLPIFSKCVAIGRKNEVEASVRGGASGGLA